MYRTLLVYVILILLCIPVLSQSKKTQRAEQTVFDVEQEDVGVPIVRPVSIPPEVLNLLASSSPASKCEFPASGIPTDWFIASEVHLSNSKQADLIVQDRNLKGDRSVENSCLHGANIGPFWVFRRTSNGYSLVLGLETKGLKLLRSRTNGYHDIEIWAATAAQYSVSILKFDGTQYRLFQSTTKDID